jgi:probable rRNA maturation factor
MAISFHAVDINYRIQHKMLLRQWIKEAIIAEKFVPGNVNIILCSDDHLLAMNKQFLNHDYYTDIITFDYCTSTKTNGDLYISVDRVMDNAKKIGTPYELELYRVVIHGVMHLVGFKDKTKSDALNMRKKEDFYLNILKKKIDRN